VSRLQLDIEGAKSAIEETLSRVENNRATKLELLLVIRLEVAVAEIEAWRQYGAGIDEALNSGDGTYKP
jgi:hypothetical protein